MTNKLKLLVITLCTITLNNIESVYSMEQNEQSRIILNSSLQDTDDTEQSSIDSNNSSKNQINLSNSNDTNDTLEREQLKTAANLITVQDIELLEKRIGNSNSPFNYKYLNVEDEDKNWRALMMQGEIKRLKECIVKMQQYPSRHNIMRCYIGIKEIISSYVNVGHYNCNFDNLMLDVHHENLDNCDLDLNNIKPFLRYFEDNIFSQICEIPIDRFKYFTVNINTVSKKYLSAISRDYIPHIINISGTINNCISKLQNSMITFKRELKFVEKHNKLFSQHEILEFLSNLDKAINEKQYYKIIQLDNNKIYYQLCDIMLDEIHGKNIVIAIRDICNSLYDIIFKFRSFSNYLYKAMESFHKKNDILKNDVKLKKIIEEIELAN